MEGREREKGRKKEPERDRKKKEKQILLELRQQNADRNRDCFIVGLCQDWWCLLSCPGSRQGLVYLGLGYDQE